MAPQVTGDACPSHPPDFGSDLLDCDHERKAEHKGPGEAVAELSADLAVRADPAWIVVGSACYKPRSECPKKAPRGTICREQHVPLPCKGIGHGRRNFKLAQPRSAHSLPLPPRSEQQTSELQLLMRITYDGS